MGAASGQSGAQSPWNDPCGFGALSLGARRLVDAGSMAYSAVTQPARELRHEQERPLH